MLTVHKSDVDPSGLQKVTNLIPRESSKKGMVSNLSDICFAVHMPCHTLDKVDNAIAGRPALSRVPSIPELNLTRHHPLAVLEPFAPIVKHPRFLEAILDTPDPNLTELCKENFPLAKALWKPFLGLPHPPKRHHLPQRLLVCEDHEYAAPKVLVPLCVAIAQSKEVVVRRDCVDVNLGKPLHSRHPLHGANEIVHRPHCLQNYHFLRH